MSQVEFDFIAENKPDNLPSPEQIMQRCLESMIENDKNKIYFRGVALFDESESTEDRKPIAWAKYSVGLHMSEARTQHYVAQIVNGDKEAPVRIPEVYCSFKYNCWGYIIMEYIDGDICVGKDARAVARALDYLVTIKAPTEQPGPVGGGRICHKFFVDHESSVAYPSVDLLEQHINGILKWERRPQRVNLRREVQEHGLRLCPADMNRANFMKPHDGSKIVAIDFDSTSFLPVSFFDMALVHYDNFTTILRKLVHRPPYESTQAESLLTAAMCLVPYQSNEVALPHELITPKMREAQKRRRDYRLSLQSKSKSSLQ